MRVAVVGSGLSGLACARALIRRGLRPVMIDAGMTLEQPIQETVDRMKTVEPAVWRPEDIALIRRNITIKQAGIPRKQVFGSDYIYARDHPEAGIFGSQVKVLTTLAKGGFSNAWGATLLPAVDCDIADDWPITARSLAPHYRAVMAWLPLSAADDGLAQHFPTYAERHGTLPLAPQAQSLQCALKRIADERIAFGQARLAVETTGRAGCRYCGLCLSGCVYGSIFNAAYDVDCLAREQRLEYWPGFIALHVSEGEGSVRLTMRRIAGGVEEHRFDRVFLAAGAVNSTRIVLQSLKAFNIPIEFADSQKFLQPIFRLKGQPYQIDHMNGLAALFIELRLNELGDNWMHIQVSTVGDFLVRRLRADRSRLAAGLMSPLLRRIVTASCSLHSRHSATLSATLRRRGENTIFELSETNRERAQRSVTLAAGQIARLAWRLQSFSPPWLVTNFATGVANHLGGSLPMRDKPRDLLETDVLGRPATFSAVHVVDSAVMPSIPATPIALLMMANADRIGTNSPLT
jgi:choline dehydrogenase-like flavoprotein